MPLRGCCRRNARRRRRQGGHTTRRTNHQKRPCLPPPPPLCRSLTLKGALLPNVFMGISPFSSSRGTFWRVICGGERGGAVVNFCAQPSVEARRARV